MKKFCKIIIVGSRNDEIRHYISLVSFLLQTTLLLEKEFYMDKPATTHDPTKPEPLATLSPMQFVELMPPLPVKSKSKKPLTENPSISLNDGENAEESEVGAAKPVVLVPKPLFVTADYESVHSLNLKNRLNKFGNSLFGDVCTWYCGGFVVMGLPRFVSFQNELTEDLELMQKESMDGDQRLPDQTSCIIVDIDEL